MQGSENALKTYRADTPGASGVVHLNNAGAALSPNPVILTVEDYLHREAVMGGYEAASEAQSRIAAVYQSLAQLVGATPEEIAFMDSATRAWNTLVYSLRFSPGDRILTSQNEFGSNVVSLAQIAAQSGAHVQVISNDEEGQMSLSDFRNQLDEHVKLVAVTHFAMQRGVANPVNEIGAILRDHPALYLVDACQSVGQMSVDVNEIGCDALTVTGRKWLRGPRGTGFLFLRKAWITKIEPSTVDLVVADLAHPDRMLRDTELLIREDIKRFEMWERSFALMLGLGAAAEYALSVGVGRIQAVVSELASSLRRGIADVSALRVEDGPKPSGGIVTASWPDHDVNELKKALTLKGINTSVVNDYDGPLDLPTRGLRSALRVSPHYYNSREDIEKFLEAVEDICRK